MKCMFVGMAGNSFEEMVKGFYLDIDFPFEEVDVPEKFESLVRDLKKCKLSIQENNKDYSLDVVLNQNKIKIIKNENYQHFLNSFSSEKQKLQNSIKKNRI